MESALIAAITVPLIILVIFEMVITSTTILINLQNTPDVKDVASANASITGDWLLVKVEVRNYGRVSVHLEKVVVSYNNGFINIEVNSSGVGLASVNSTVFRVWSDLNSSRIPSGTMANIYINITNAFSTGLYTPGEMYYGSLRFNETIANFGFRVPSP